MKSLPERMREAAQTMEEARKRLPRGYSPEYEFDITTLRSWANVFENEDIVKDDILTLLRFHTNVSCDVYAERFATAFLKKYEIKLRND